MKDTTKGYLVTHDTLIRGIYRYTLFKGHILFRTGKVQIYHDDYVSAINSDLYKELRPEEQQYLKEIEVPAAPVRELKKLLKSRTYYHDKRPRSTLLIQRHQESLGTLDNAVKAFRKDILGGTHVQIAKI